MIHRLIVSAVPGLPGEFAGHLEGDGRMLVRSRQPMVAAARAMLEQGFDPTELLTMRHTNALHDSFQPLSIAQWLKE